MCQHCKIKHPLKQSTRKHRRPPREFWLCPCGREVEGIVKTRADGTEYVMEVKARAVKSPSLVRSTRLYLWEEAERQKMGETVRGYIERKAREKAAG